jgi:hypothetical protein
VNDIFDRISREMIKTGDARNIIYMNMADYRALCEWAKDKWTAGATHVYFPGGILMTRETAEPKPDTILGMKIIKRAGAMECAFDESVVSQHNRIFPQRPNVGQLFLDTAYAQWYKYNGVHWEKTEQSAAQISNEDGMFRRDAPSGQDENNILLNEKSFTGLLAWVEWATGELEFIIEHEHTPDGYVSNEWKDGLERGKAILEKNKSDNEITAINPNITLTYSNDPPSNNCIITWIDQYSGEQFKRTVKQDAAFMIMGKLKSQGEKNIAAILTEDDFITKEDIRCQEFINKGMWAEYHALLTSHYNEKMRAWLEEDLKETGK